jgi:hypothetical protein
LLVGEEEIADVAWSYEQPTVRFASIRGCFAFYPRRVDECSVDGEIVDGNAGDFYGGWITPASSDRSKVHLARCTGDLRPRPHTGHTVHPGLC